MRKKLLVAKNTSEADAKALAELIYDIFKEKKRKEKDKKNE